MALPLNPAYANDPYFNSQNYAPTIKPPSLTTGGTSSPPSLYNSDNKGQYLSSLMNGASPQQAAANTFSGSSAPLGTIAKSPVQNLPKSSNTLSSGNSAGTNGGSGVSGGVNTNYYMQPGESMAAYNARITSYNATPQASQTNASLGYGSTPAPTTPPATSAAPNQPAPPSAPSTNPYQATAPTYPGLVGALAGTASQPSAAFTQAQQTAAQALEDLQTSRKNEADALSLNSQNPIPLEFQQGRGQILQNQYLQQQNAYANTYQGATAQEAAATGQQSAQQTGLTEAGSLSQPQQANPTNVTFNPLTGQYGNNAASSYGANGLQNLGSTLNQQNIGANVSNLNSALGAAQVVGNNLQSLITQNNINPSGLSVVNGVIQFGANQMGNPQYQEFQGQVNDFINKIAPILGGPNGNTTDYKTQLAGQIVNSLASGQNINQVIQYFMSQAQQAIQGYSQGGGVGTAGSAQGQGGGNTFGNFFGGK